MRPPRNALRLIAICATPLCAMAVSSCGTSGGAPAAKAGPLLKLAQCMRAHGVPNFPDPPSTGGLIIPNSINTGSPAFQSAQRACASLGAPAGSQRQSGSRQAQFLAMARCMRAHGVSGFADPTSSPPPPSSGNVIGGDGWYLALGTAQERQSPVYQRAASVCGAHFP
jgi:hypothetical protein